jgi:uncharacterized membrane protein HdeD (DUF308 family)
LISQGAIQTFGLPGSFQIVFLAIDRPILAFDVTTIVCGGLVGILGLVAILNVHRRTKWAAALIPLPLCVLAMGLYSAAYVSVASNAAYVLEVLLSAAVLFMAAFNIHTIATNKIPQSGQTAESS